jgi:hypothetical protein
MKNQHLLMTEISRKDRKGFNLRTKCVALARQNARSDRVCLDFSLVTFFVAMTKKVTIKKEFAVLPPPAPPPRGGYTLNQLTL